MRLADTDSLQTPPPVTSEKYAKTKDLTIRRRYYESPRRLLALLVVSIFFAETGVMLVLGYYNIHPVGWEAFLDSSALVLILSPTFYYFFFRPLTHHISKLKKSESRIRFLSRELIISSEEERKKLARDLHDEFGQTLTSTMFKIESLKDSLPSDLEEQRQDCETLMGVIDKLGNKVRNFSGTLRPVLLDKLGVVAALQGHVEALSLQHPSLEMDFEAFGVKRRPDPQIEIVLYRVCQEGLNNVIKHAQATRADIRLTCSHPKIILTLKDNGNGFDPKEQLNAIGREHHGFGLLGMKERVEGVGGRLMLFSGIGKGTLVRTELPMISTDN